MRISTKRWIGAALLALLALSTSLSAVGCAKAGDDVDTNVTTGAGSAATGEGAGTETEVETSAYSTIEKQKFDREFVVGMVADSGQALGKNFEFKAEELTGEIMNDRIYERNSMMKEDFGVEVVPNCFTEDMNMAIRKQVSGGLDEFDVMIGNKNHFFPNILNHNLYNLGDVAEIDLTHPWWDQAFYKSMTVDGKTFGVIGDINPFSMTISSCLIYNKTIMKETNQSVDELNKAVREGKWTLNRLYDMTKDITLDMNGDDVLDPKVDRYGMTCWMMDVPYAMFYGAGSCFVRMDEYQQPVLDFNMDRVVEIYDMIYKIVREREAYMAETEPDYFDNVYQIFQEGRALFCDTTLNKITGVVVGHPVEYGIIPEAKFDENQEEYFSFVNGATTITMVMNTEKDPGFVATMLEAMSAYNYDHVTPDLFEVVTKLQTAQDPDSSAMVDYIVRNRVYDFAYVSDMAIGECIRMQLVGNKTEIASMLAKQQKVAGKLLEKYVRKIMQFGD